MDHAQYQESIPKALLEVSSALIALRDALVKVSLLLKDMQFEMDQEERNKAESAVRELMKTMRSNRGPDDVNGSP